MNAGKPLEELKGCSGFFKNFVDESPNMIFINFKGKIVYINKRCIKMMGYSKKEFYSKHFSFIKTIHPDDKKEVLQKFKAHQQGKKVLPYECRILAKNGDVYHVIITTKLVDYLGERAILGLITNITARKKTEDELEIYKFLAEQAPYEVAIADFKGRIKCVNDSWAKNHGYKKEELIGKHLSIFHAKEELPKVRRFNRKLMKKGKCSEEIVHKRKDGTTYHALMDNFVLYVDGRPKLLVGTAVDVTEQNKAEEKLRENEERFRTIFESSPLGMLITSKEGMIIDVNRTFQKMLGYQKSEMHRHFNKITHPEDAKIGLDALNSLISGKKERITFEKRYVKKDGGIINCQVYVSSIFDADKNLKYFIAVVENITQQQKIQQELKELAGLTSEYPHPVLRFSDKFELIYANKSGKKLLDKIGCRGCLTGRTSPKKLEKDIRKYFNTKKKTPFEVGYNGNVFSFIISPGREKKYLNLYERDITLMKKTEKIIKREEEHKLEIEKLKEIDELKTQFLSMASHELKTPLTPIRSQLQRLLSLNLPSEEIKSSLEMILRNSFRLEGLIDDLLEISRIESKKIRLIKQKSSIAKIIKNSIGTMLPYAKDNDIEIITEIEDKIPLINLDLDKIERVMINLLKNAVRHSRAKKIIISAEKKKNRIMVCVKDDGIGISKDDISHLFELFFINRKVYSTSEGTGLGLPICKGIVEAHHGKITVKSELGKGAEFCFYLPFSKRPKKNLNKEKILKTKRGQK